MSAKHIITKNISNFLRLKNYHKWQKAQVLFYSKRIYQLICRKDILSLSTKTSYYSTSVSVSFMSQYLCNLFISRITKKKKQAILISRCYIICFFLCISCFSERNWKSIYSQAKYHPHILPGNPSEQHAHGAERYYK